MDLAELGKTQRQVAIAFAPMGENRDGTRAVHRLEGKDPLVLGRGGEHRVAVVLPVPGDFPQPPVHHIRGIVLAVV